MSIAGRHIIALEITTRCASKCVKCYRRHIWGNGVKMSDELFQNVIDGLTKLGNTIDILLGTGEALLEREKLTELIHWSTNSGGEIKLLTQGIPLVPKNIEILKNATNLTMQVTFDGFYQEELHGVQRTNLELVKKRVFSATKVVKTELNYTLTNRNYNSLVDFVDFAASCNVNRVYVTPIKVYEPCSEALKLVPDFSLFDIMQSIERASNRAIELGIVFSAPTYNETKQLTNSELLSNCKTRGYLRPIIRVDGLVSVCWGREDVILGDLSSQGLDEIITSEALKELIKLQDEGHLASFCSNCIIKENSAREILHVPTREQSYFIESLDF